VDQVKLEVAARPIVALLPATVAGEELCLETTGACDDLTLYPTVLPVGVELHSVVTT
jgi:hypothetical protein